MILLAALAICLLTVPLLGGRLGSLASIEFARPWAGLLALALQYAILGLFPEGDPALHGALHLVSYGLMFYFLAANLSLPGLWLIGFGGASNAVAIAANNGVMPAHPSALATAGVVETPGEFTNSGAVEDPKLWFLGDVFAIPEGVPMANVFSVGDIILIAGAAVLLHRVCESRLGDAMGRLAAWVDRTSPRLALIREHRAFRRLWFAQSVSAVGDWVYPLAVFTAVLQDEGAKASSLAFLLIAQVGPGMVVGLFGGPLLDRFSRKAAMFWSDVVRGLAVMTLLLSADPGLGHLYAVALVLGVGSALNQPAFQASLPNILPANLLASANALFGLTMSLAIVVGPLLGALVVSQFGIGWGFTANAASFIYSAALVLGTDMPRRAVAVTETFLDELRVGMRYVVRHRDTLAVVVVVGIVTLAAGIKQPLEPLFALDDLAAGAGGYGLLQAGWGLGMVIGAVVAAAVDRRMGHGPLLTVSVALVGATVLLSAGAPGIEAVLVLWLVAGVVNTLGTVAYETLLQEETPDAFRGRVFAAVEASTQAGLLAGIGIMVAVGDLLPVRLGLALSGALFLIAAVVSWQLLQRRRTPSVAPIPAAAAGPVPFAVEGVRILPAGPELALLRISTYGAGETAPVLLVDDGSRVHRVQALPGLNGGAFGYGVPTRLLAARWSALALEVGERLFDLPFPARTTPQ